MSDLLARLAEMIDEIIIGAEDEPQFTTREHAVMGAEEMYRDLIMPALAEVWDEGHGDGYDNAIRQPSIDHGTREAITNPYRQEQDR